MERHQNESGLINIMTYFFSITLIVSAGALVYYLFLSPAEQQPTKISANNQPAPIVTSVPTPVPSVAVVETGSGDMMGEEVGTGTTLDSESGTGTVVGEKKPEPTKEVSPAPKKVVKKTTPTATPKPAVTEKPVETAE